MTKAEFLLNLQNRLCFLSAQELEKAMSFYSEAIDDRMENGFSEEEAVADLGNIDEIVKNIEIELPITELVKNKVKKSRDKSDNKTLWIILTICTAPFWLPLAVAFCAIVFAIYIVIWAVIFCLYAALFSFAVTAVAGIFAGIIRGFLISPAHGLMVIGVSIVCAGLFILLIKPVVLLTKKLIQLTALIAKKIKGLFVSKKEVI